MGYITRGKVDFSQLMKSIHFGTVEVGKARSQETL